MIAGGRVGYILGSFSFAVCEIGGRSDMTVTMTCCGLMWFLVDPLDRVLGTGTVTLSLLTLGAVVLDKVVELVKVCLAQDSAIDHVSILILWCLVQSWGGLVLVQIRVFLVAGRGGLRSRLVLVGHRLRCIFLLRLCRLSFLLR